ncbi:MAG TPA: extracellular solute-binding protein [bacterium]|nr:extracellular solute-binding protein [bacterium]
MTVSIAARLCAVVAGLMVFVSAGEWAGTAGGGGMPRAAAAAAPVRVLYAGSLLNVFERDLAPAFTRRTGIIVLGRAGGSTSLAHLIRDGLAPADVFVSADPVVNRILAPRAGGPAAGNDVTKPGAPSVGWFLTCGSTSMVIAYAPGSRFAPLLRQAVDPGPAGPADPALQRRAWFRVLATPGLRLGRTDPALDPKGYRALFVLKLAERYYHDPGLAARVLGDEENPSQIFPEEALLGRLDSGQLDAGFFYLVEAIARHLPYLTLPPALNLADPAFAAAYATATYVDTSGVTHRGGPVLYTVAIPSSARNTDGAARFVAFLLGPEGRGLLAARGVLRVPILAGGDPATIPASLRPLVGGTYHP